MFYVFPVSRRTFISPLRSSVHRRQLSSPAIDPLRILFCGSDEFSCESLRALHQEYQSSPDSIESIDVLVRPAKRSGRGLKTIKEVPLRRVAQRLGLALHERDTFTGWTLPKSHGKEINLIVAVSFGLFVPARILNSTEYGGINLHPSLLPDFRGPAPLHHQLLAGETHTGITLQTLHPEKFDHGAILSQTPRPGLSVPNAALCTLQELLGFIKPKAARMLVEGIRKRVFVPPIKDLMPIPEDKFGPIRHAPKITPADRQIDWDTMTASDICRHDRVMGRLWSLYHPEGDESRRIIFHGLEEVPIPKTYLDWQQGKSVNEAAIKGLSLSGQGGKSVRGPPFLKDGGCLVIITEGNQAIRVREITKEGERRLPAAEALLGKSGADAMLDVMTGAVVERLNFTLLR